MSTVPADRSLIQLPLPLAGDGAARRRERVADVHAISIPAKSFTGDFYVTHRDHDRLWFAVGDVAGKGLNAALIMAMIQEELEHRIESCAAALCDPSATTARLHEFLRPNLPPNRFATAVIGRLDADGALVLTNGGHTPPLIRRRNGTVEEIGSTGPVLGLLPESRWCSTKRRLEAGESLLLYTDGVVEAQDAKGEELGIDRLRDIFGRAGAAAEPREVADGVAAAVRRHAGRNEDDLTIVVLRA
jgi:sigma-B regulation protein RsbU (phosphoserine phosphatase)